MRADRRPLAGLLVGHAVSMTGNMMTIIALPLYVLMETGSAAATGITGFFATLPIVVGGVLGGVVVDRIGYRRASVLADVVSGATIAVVPMLHLTVGVPFPVLLALVFAAGCSTHLARRPGRHCCPRSRRAPASLSSGRSGCSRQRSAAPGSSAPPWPGCLWRPSGRFQCSRSTP